MITDMMHDIKNLQRRSVEMDKETDEMKDRVVYLKKLKEEKEKDYLELLRSKSWKRVNEREKELSEIREESVKLEMDIRNELSALRRPMKKLEYILGKTSKSDKDSLKGFLTEPFETYIVGGGEDSLGRIMKSLSDGVISGEIDLKDSDKERVNYFIKKGEKELSEIKSKLMERREMVAEVRKKIGSAAALVKKKEDLEEDVKNHASERNDVEEKIKRSVSEFDDINENLDKKKTEIEQKILDKTGKMIRIS